MYIISLTYNIQFNLLQNCLFKDLYFTVVINQSREVSFPSVLFNEP